MIERGVMEKKFLGFLLALLVLVSFPVLGYSAEYPAMKVVDYLTGQPIEGAKVTSGNELILTDPQGLFLIPKGGNKLKVRAYGYQRTEVSSCSLLPNPQVIRLVPFTPKALYLTFYGVGERVIREPALNLIQHTELNALVIDIKGDRGWIPY